MPSRGPVPVVTGFAERLSEALYRLDRREYGEDLSFDAFLYTRAAVVADGRAAYEEVPADPVLFAPCAEEPTRAEPLSYVPDRAYEHLTGEGWRRDTRYSYGSFSDRGAGSAGRESGRYPAGPVTRATTVVPGRSRPRAARS
ncbi:hypothetical protein SUDANB121_02818 [Nocardiopsis dassonvillei]